jgi:hypothetical protein
MGGHDYNGPINRRPTPRIEMLAAGTVRTQNTEEQFAIRELVVHRGIGFTIAMFYGTEIGIDRISDIYIGRPITEGAFKTLKTVLRERMTLT